MSEPMMLRVMKELCRQIEIRAGLEGFVFRGQSYFGPTSEGMTKMVSVIVDSSSTDDFPNQSLSGNASIVNLPLILMGYDATNLNTSENPTDDATIMAHSVYKALIDVKREGAAGDLSKRNILGMGHVVDDIIIGNYYPYPEFANENTSCAFWLMPVTIKYVDNE